FGTRSGCLCSFQVLPVRAGLSQFCGGNCERETPLPIPNREVKPLSADGTWPSRARESRTPPVFELTSRPAGRLVVGRRGLDWPFARRLTRGGGLPPARAVRSRRDARAQRDPARRQPR